MNTKERIQLFIKEKGLSVRKFEELCELSNGYIASMRKNFGSDKLSNVLQKFPDLNREWLMFGEGEMLKKTNIQTAYGDNNTQVAGDAHNINNSATLDKALTEVAEMRKLIQEQVKNNQEQINRLMTMLEELTKKTK